ncbi:site-2 protease family protein [Eubacterium multiforme]|uniref:Peptidase M50 domain-containing protein n=1 Tax=Eubacterium multiforme TaxID=83339 RepID=A0ABT9UTJ5_9FIRM|nr:site-2 protease family protein [Eubacterium multiforme]MDQ0149648.1 hypothetical protein [Eubacterium multiforme]
MNKEDINVHNYCPIKGRHIIEFDSEENKGIIFNKNKKKSYILGTEEFKVFKKLDGRRSINQLQKECNYYTIDDICSLIIEFHKLGILNEEEDDYEKIKISNIKIPLFCPDKKMDEIKNIIKVFSNIIKYVSLPIFICGIYKFDFENFYKAIKHFSLIESGIISFVFMIIVVALHELGHAIVAKNNGAYVPEIGIMLYYLLPVAYTTVCGTQILKKKKKIEILLAGIEVNLFLLGITMFLIKILPKGYENIILISLILSNIIPILSNISIFYKFDFYYILQELLEEYKLKENSDKFIKNIIKGKSFIKISNEKKLMYILYSSISSVCEYILIIFIVLSIFKYFINK